MSNYIDRIPFTMNPAWDNLLASPSVKISDSGFYLNRFQQSAEKKRRETIEKKNLKKGVAVETVDGTRTTVSEICDNGEIKTEAYSQTRVNPMSLKLL